MFNTISAVSWLIVAAIIRATDGPEIAIAASAIICNIYIAFEVNKKVANND